MPSEGWSGKQSPETIPQGRHSAIARHDSTNATSLVVEADQPTIAREYKSIAKAT